MAGEKQVLIHPSAVVTGAVKLGNQVSIWPQAAVRADMNSITVGDGSNIQDGAVLHVDTDCPLEIGSNVTIGHQAVLHGCTVEENCLIGIGAIVLDRANIGKDSLIAAGTLVSPGKRIPPRSLVMGTPGRIIRSLSDDEVAKIKNSAATYWNLAQKAKEQE